MLSIDEQLKIIKKRTLEIINEDELIEKLKKGRPLNVKLGVDPTSPDIHLGHTVVLNKLRDFQILGHQIILIIGSGTAVIGDPSGRDKTRSLLTIDEIERNAKYYSEQAFKILDKEKTIIRFNGDWLLNLTLKDLVSLSSHFTIARILERDDFFNRYKSGSPIYLHEFFYPVMQAYDSIVIDADIELGGSDQKFNLLCGRELQKELGKEEQIAILMPILRGIDGEKRMGKSLGNYIGINENPKEMFGKIMSIPDHLIIEYFELLTDISPKEIEEYKIKMEEGENPMKYKLRLAKEIVARYHSKEAADKEEEDFIKVFSKKEIPEEVETFFVDSDEINLIDFLKEKNIVSSKSEGRRIFEQGGIYVNNERFSDSSLKVKIDKEVIIKVGKRKFIKVIKND
ncbi:MAG TPA: tyrosine--tRNA ligase [Caldisericia bacterium]|nr:tyrosine--tRNA ligase [Caldisericia bacterium]HOL82871.1 tyrosine--tRNA ligase [Caldisericia bacterium]HPC56354.1 tyrosine--tRNA ligase [Caldisericia bacterium]HPP43216.1 tyrosine--tRNA ligase [Caldisericia bacterium]HRT37002.1 tyrosine--tRNA ligase [Caldisericia bacterium]